MAKMKGVVLLEQGDALLESGLRGIAYQEVFGPDEKDCQARLHEIETRLESQLERACRRVQVGLSPHAPYTVSARLFRAITALALKRGLPVSTHAAESLAELALVRDGGGAFADFLKSRGIAWKATGLSTVKYLAETGLMETRPLLVHAVQTEASDLEILRASGAAVAHCPKSNAKLGHGTAPLLEYLGRGIRVGLGTDGPVSSNGCDFIEEARTAILLQRARRDVDTAVSQCLDPRAMLRLMTLGGAEALGLDSEIGSLESGKLADLTAISLSAPHQQPLHDPETAIIFSASDRDVVLTMVGGRVLLQGGVVTTLDEIALRKDLERAARKLWS